MALIGNTPDTYNQTWHLPCDDNRLTYKQLINLASDVCQKTYSYSILKLWMFKIGGLFNKRFKEIQELLPRYKVDNIFISEKFKKRFPDFAFTTYQQGVSHLIDQEMK